MQRTGISLPELQPDTKVLEVIGADVNAHDRASDQTANPNARGEYLVDAAMDVNCTFLFDPEEHTRHCSVMGAISSPDATIVYAAIRDIYDLEPHGTQSSGHHPILVPPSNREHVGGNGSSDIRGGGFLRLCSSS